MSKMWTSWDAAEDPPAMGSKEWRGEVAVVPEMWMVEEKRTARE